MSKKKEIIPKPILLYSFEYSFEECRRLALTHLKSSKGKLTWKTFCETNKIPYTMFINFKNGSTGNDTTDKNLLIDLLNIMGFHARIQTTVITVENLNEQLPD
jgi:hypothetical protein